MFTLPDYAIRLPYRAIDPCPKFISPDYSTTGPEKKQDSGFQKYTLFGIRR